MLSEVLMVKKKTVKKITGRKKVKKIAAGQGKKTKTKPEKKSAALLEELLPAESAGSGKGHAPVEKKKRKKRTKVKFKSVMLREEAISYFEAIVSGLKRGSIKIRKGDDVIVLKPTPQLDVVVKATSKDQDENIEFQIRWRRPSDSELTISTK